MSMDNQQLQTTPLYDLHIASGAKMVPFAGYQMPVSYPPGIVKEHLHTRQQCGLFDVSHMGIIELRGEQAAARLESLMPVDLQTLQQGRQKYALFTNDEGGIRDDLMVARLPDRFVLVVNAACKQADYAHLEARLGASVALDLRTDQALLALQGPTAAAVMARLGTPLSEMQFMQVVETQVAGHRCVISRSGYTGEDGFEIALAASAAADLAQRLLAQAEVEWVGLGARDTLRLEAGLCLYGHDLNPQTTPVEAGLNWSLSPARRANGARAGGFPGADVIQAQFPRAVERKRVGLIPTGRAPVREGCALFDHSGRPVGTVSSGGFSPTLGHPICMAYVRVDCAAIGTELQAQVRGKNLPVVVRELPFVPHRYQR